MIRQRPLFRQVAVLLTLGLLVAAPPVAVTGAGAAPATAAAGQETAANATDTRASSASENTVFSAAASAPDGLVVGGATVADDPATGDSNAVIRKLGANGTVVWSRTFDTQNRSAVVNLATGPAGEVYALRFASGRTPREPGSASLTLHRLSETGETVWQREIGPDRTVGRSGALAASDQGPAVVFQTRTDNGSMVSLSRFTPDGDRAWTRDYDTDARPGVLRATDDGYLVAGTGGFRQPWLLRTDRGGQERLRTTVPGIESGRPVAAFPTDDGGVILTGSYAGDGGPAPWAARVGTDGVARWSRVYPTDGELRVRAAAASGDELVLVGGSRYGGDENQTARLVGIDRDGERRSDRTVEGMLPTAAVAGQGDRLTVVGLRGPPSRNPTGIVRRVTRGTDRLADTRPGAERLSANRTYYRGQRLLVRYAPDTSFELVRRGEDTEVVRRLRLNDTGRWAVDTATLPRGDYYVRSADGAVVAREGWLISQGRPADARFRLAEHRLFGTELNRTLVDRAAGESTVTFEVGSDRPAYTLEVAVDRFRGEPADPATLRRLFGDYPGFGGVESSRDRPVARLQVGDRERITLDVSGVDPGLYSVTLRGADTGVAGAQVTKRIVVGRETPRPLSVSTDPERLSVAVGTESTTNLTIDDAAGGIAAMSISAERTGPPAVRLSTELGINATEARAGAGIGRDRASAEAQAFGGDTAEGTVEVGSLSVRAPARAIDPEANTTGTVTLRIDWAVDENGVPYTVPEPVSVPIKVTDVGNATGEQRGTGTDGGAAGSARGGGNTGSGSAGGAHTTGR